MSVLVIAEHDGKQLKSGVTNALTAAAKLGDVTVLVAGKDGAEAAQAAAKVAGVKKVLLCEAAHYEGSAGENIAALVVGIANDYTHILAPATSFGKNVTTSAASNAYGVRARGMAIA